MVWNDRKLIQLHAVINIRKFRETNEGAQEPHILLHIGHPSILQYTSFHCMEGQRGQIAFPQGPDLEGASVYFSKLGRHLFETAKEIL